MCSTALVVGVVGVDLAHSERATVIIGPWDGRGLMSIGTTTALVALCVAIWMVNVPTWFLAVKVVAGILAVGTAAVGFVAVVLETDARIVPVLHEGCETGYTAVERSFLFAGSSVIYRREGLVTAIEVARVRGDDGYQPFSAGGYAVEEDAGVLIVHHAYGVPEGGDDLLTGTEPAFSLPMLDGDFACGFITPNERRPIEAHMPERAPISDTEMQTAVREMLAATFEAVPGVSDADGTLLDAETVPLMTFTCTSGESSGTGYAATVDLAGLDAPDDMLTRVLTVWDDAGYQPDRAIQEDIRYSDVLPIERMAIRDRSSVDALLHMSIVSACATAP